MASPATLTLTQTATACGLSHYRFRRVWRNWTVHRQFPGPIKGDPMTGEPYAWDPEALKAWKDQRSYARQCVPAPAPANDPASVPAPNMTHGPAGRIHRDRDAIARRMGAM